eukprot:1229089-Amphidinium_carterae.1
MAFREITNIVELILTVHQHKSPKRIPQIVLVGHCDCKVKKDIRGMNQIALSIWGKGRKEALNPNHHKSKGRWSPIVASKNIASSKDITVFVSTSRLANLHHGIILVVIVASMA